MLCVSVSLILLLTVFISTDEPGDNTIIGIASDIKATQSGYTFTIEDIDGVAIRCFTTDKPSKNKVYCIKGTFSDNNSMLFVSSIHPINHNEF